MLYLIDPTSVFNVMGATSLLPIEMVSSRMDFPYDFSYVIDCGVDNVSISPMGVAECCLETVLAFFSILDCAF